MAYNRELFFKGYRSEIGKLSQSQVTALTFLLDAIESDTEIKDLREVAYILATILHETARTFEPIEEYGKGRGRKYGIADPVTNQKYFGRGYVQLTWKRNYQVFADLLGVDLVNNPELALDPQIAWQITSIGMRKGLFTGKKLSNYIFGIRGGLKKDYIGARKIINGTDKAQLIAGYAEDFEKILSASTVSDDWLSSEAATVSPDSPADLTRSEGATGETQTKETSVTVTDGNVKVETSEGAKPAEKVAIEKPQPLNFSSKMRNKVAALTGGNMTLQGIRDYAEQAKLFGLSLRFWFWVSMIGIIATAVYLIAEFYKHRSDVRRDMDLTNQLIQANSTESNKVVLVDKEKIDEYEDRGYKIIHR